MSNHLLVCIGGTGQHVLHYYLQLYLLGLAPDRKPLRAVVIDQANQFWKSVELSQALFQRLCPKGEFAEGGAGPWIRTASLEGLDPAVRFSWFLTRNNEELDVSDPARAFFESTLLREVLNEGLFARPCVGSVLWEKHGKEIRESLVHAIGEAGGAACKVVVCCSVYGGTGGGLVLPVLRFLTRETTPRPSRVAALLFRPYFESAALDRAKIAEHESNASALKHYIEDCFRLAADGGFDLHFVDYLGGGNKTNKVRKEPGIERKSHLPFPTDNQPFWHAPSKVADMFLDMQANRPVEPRPAPSLAPVASVLWPGAHQRVRQVIKGLDFLCEQEGIERAGADPFGSRVWGRDLVKSLGALAETWRKKGDRSDRKEFFAKVGLRLEAEYGSRSSNSGLKSIFPEIPSGGRSSSETKALQRRFPNPLNAAPDGLDSQEAVEKYAAAFLLFHLLSGAA